MSGMPVWTVAMEEGLRQLLTDAGYGFPPYSKIAALLTAEHGVPLTANSIAGKVNRIGWQGLRPAGRSSVRPSEPPTAPRPTKRMRPRPFARAQPPDAARAERPAKPCTLLKLGIHSCRWPVGVSARGECLFCAEKKNYEDSYCAEHIALSYVGGKRR